VPSRYLLFQSSQVSENNRVNVFAKHTVCKFIKRKGLSCQSRLIVTVSQSTFVMLEMAERKGCSGSCALRLQNHPTTAGY
jgi:hypothetical protein